MTGRRREKSLHLCQQSAAGGGGNVPPFTIGNSSRVLDLVTEISFLRPLRSEQQPSLLTRVTVRSCHTLGKIKYVAVAARSANMDGQPCGGLRWKKCARLDHFPFRASRCILLPVARNNAWSISAGWLEFVWAWTGVYKRRDRIKFNVAQVETKKIDIGVSYRVIFLRIWKVRIDSVIYRTDSQFHNHGHLHTFIQIVNFGTVQWCCFRTAIHFENQPQLCM
jgi:hypothetical protein